MLIFRMNSNFGTDDLDEFKTRLKLLSMLGQSLLKTTKKSMKFLKTKTIINYDS